MKFVGGTVRYIYRHRQIFAVLAFAVFVLAGLVVKFAPFKTNVFDLLPFADDEITDSRRAAEWFGQANVLYFNISGLPAQSALECAQRLRSTLADDGFKFADFPNFAEAPREIAGAFPSLFADSADLQKRICKEEISKRFSYYKRKMSGFEAPVFRAAFVYDPMGILPRVLEKLKLYGGGTDGAKIFSGVIGDADEKNFLLIARADASSADSEAAARICELAQAGCARVGDEFKGAQVDWTGAYRIAADNAAIARADSSLCLGLTGVLMVALCFFAFRNRVYSLLCVVPSFLGSAFALCFAALTFGEISNISIAFASIAMGVSIDYAIHVLHALDMRGMPTINESANAAQQLFSPIMVICSTTLLAFFVIAFLGGGMFQLGAFGFVGVLVSALISVFVLPAFAVGLARKTSGSTFIARISGAAVLPSSRKPYLFIFLAAVFTILSLPFAAGIKFDGRISSMSALSAEGAAADAKLRAVWSESISRPMLAAAADNLDNALEVLAKVETELAKVGGVEVAKFSELAPDSATANKNIERWKAFWTPEKLAQFRKDLQSVCAENGVNASVFDAALSAIANPKICKNGLLGAPETSKIFVSRVFEDGNIAAVCTPLKIAEYASKESVAAMIRGVDKRAFLLDMQYLGEHISDITRATFLKCALITLAAAALYLALAMRSIKMAAAVMACVGVGLAWCFAIMAIFKVDITLTNSIFVIFSICLAQDYAVMVIWSSVREKRGDISANPVVVSALTTAFAFGALSIAEHPVIRGLGLAAGISIVSILCASLWLAPAFAKLMGGSFERLDEK